ncbi:hypothetical protein CLV63_103257 [Murinocardiopsis flavida]|uniref:Uncharacterized protein n=1 Tax=Murinocardiopsis flavida TaxID=645275 RepID=A0A2P8DQQ3_9ACTN|nr:hypothetical protein [Murinocardiopsis flavida]PSK99532.1 hypothetical protein CLV63_103257 [Murinocardiopsis flavida]
MPIRPANLATMSATIAAVVRPEAGADAVAPTALGPVTITYESGYRQVVEAAGATELADGHGGIVELEAGTRTGYELYADAACSRAKRLRAGNGPARFLAPLHAHTIVLGD